ncbi:AcrR family transcriptional regulator [Lipingzhangella halophila]|uniref:AcrR family transcriptional regulator n=1 Tax=Lipingzhangella halophila TaxID=1783352 RepID=A0A7W7W4F1_9ACTN|nr:TetR family transcriptional regulator C-terminal domain-containing protein [Lipingzhangella halophila]MBB4933523.1 AcrR family transcriptional regulator [Lipingzhangella halophila]
MGETPTGEQQRRDQILNGVEGLIGRDGLQAVSMRAVAAEAGVSLRLVQYYFHTRSELLGAALRRIADRSWQRWDERVRARDGDSAREILEEFFAEALPTDEDSRAFHRVGVSFAALAISDPELAAAPYRSHLAALTGRLEELLESAYQGPRRSRRDHRHEALKLMSLAHGLGTMLMVGHIDADGAHELVNAHLDRLLAASASP